MTHARHRNFGMALVAAAFAIFALSDGPVCGSALGQVIDWGRLAAWAQGFQGAEASAESESRAKIDRDLQRFAVNVGGGLFGVYLGKGLVITAAHVVKTADPTVRVAGQTLQARIVKAGEYEKIDLTLLSVDSLLLPPGLGIRLMPVCSQPPRVGQDVLVATPQAVARSRIMSADALPAELRERFASVIPDVATTGNSGSGVFDPVNGCLMGIMSRKIRVSNPPTLFGFVKSYRDIAKYFVPAPEIRAFLDGND